MVVVYEIEALRHRRGEAWVRARGPGGESMCERGTMYRGVGVKLGDMENTSTACKSERRKGRGGEGGVRTEGAMLENEVTRAYISKHV